MLYIVATPIGNLQDISLRAIEVLKNCHLIAAEDTRKTKILLDHFQIQKALISYFEYNRLRKENQILELLKDNKDIVLVSEAGTPGISDPGVHLVDLAIKNNIPITCIPGPCALINALVLSGLPTDKFIFAGFLPRKDGPQKKKLLELANIGFTVIIYESPHRVVRLLENIQEALGDRQVAACREMTKKFEEIKRDKISNLIEHFKKVSPRGEFTIIFR
jgi:16S rRNA (cytidine1402-2'-O)-methyltransferase